MKFGITMRTNIVFDIGVFTLYMIRRYLIVFNRLHYNFGKRGAYCLFMSRRSCSEFPQWTTVALLKTASDHHLLGKRWKVLLLTFISQNYFEFPILFLSVEILLAIICSSNSDPFWVIMFVLIIFTGASSSDFGIDFGVWRQQGPVFALFICRSESNIVCTVLYTSYVVWLMQRVKLVMSYSVPAGTLFLWKYSGAFGNCSCRSR